MAVMIRLSWLLNWLFCMAVAAQAAECLPLRVGKAEGNYILPGVRGAIVYRRVNNQTLALDAYVQRRGTRRPAVFLIHGGGPAGSRVAFTGQLMESLTRAGYNWFAVEYRKENAAHSLDDLRAALAFVRCHATEFNLDAQNLALLGEDTGAQLAMKLATEKPAGVRASILIGGLYQAAATIGNFPLPATLVIHGTADREAPPEAAANYCEAIKLAGGRCDFLAVQGAIHRCENWRPEQWSYKAELAKWLARTMKLAAPNHVPYQTRLQKDIVFDSTHGLKLDAYRPAGRGPFPAIVIIHGGGWEAGDKVTYVTPLFQTLAQAGFAWFSLDYRLTPLFRHVEQLADVETALRFIRANARRFNVDPRRIALLGESASGQMAVHLAQQPNPLFAAVVSFYGVYDFTLMTGDYAPRSIPARLFGLTAASPAGEEMLRRYSPLYHVTAQQPPLLLIHGTADRLHTQGRALAERMREAKADVTLVELPDAPHGLENWENNPAWLSYKIKLVAWLKEKLRKQ
jgi:alpha-L-fucosidase 2